VTAAVSLAGAIGVVLVGSRSTAVAVAPEIQSPHEADAA
jgi:hypothetical protein